jgi:hypothetical protein
MGVRYPGGRRRMKERADIADLRRLRPGLSGNSIAEDLQEFHQVASHDRLVS